MPHPQRKTGVAFFYLSPVFPKGGRGSSLAEKTTNTQFTESKSRPIVYIHNLLPKLFNKLPFYRLFTNFSFFSVIQIRYNRLFGITFCYFVNIKN